MTKIIGLTGGIGSGKTTIANYFHAFGIPIYIADDEAKKLMDSNELKNAVQNTFGKAIMENGIMSREKLAKIVFDNPEDLEKLNAIVHPAVKSHFKKWLSQHKAAAYIIYEAAILFESGSFKNCDYIVTVTAPIETRIERVIKRDNSSREKILKRMDAQWTDTQRISKSDFIIQNLNTEEAKQEIKKILNFLKIKQKDA
ncbi:dephospho-CoA kinase [Flavobacterium micromati]|uniref:Dephospho-CoA kinase n=1 Tax=Flavobacterium micromati TaxID=229205 RepID=A0A1M5HU43_9FLAO|nr:dephospho-CoA kinase [Flavobacterium micromati]SHG19476.1 dephospho-CoA kinase [Flavobacterium micromati]